jgi:DUF2917 family protein
MLLRLKCNDFLRLRGARGVAIEVLAGRVWITEDGRADDSFLGPGRRYRVGGDGLVLVGAETYGSAAHAQSDASHFAVLNLARHQLGGAEIGSVTDHDPAVEHAGEVLGEAFVRSTVGKL